jgi:hypothetical protein
MRFARAALSLPLLLSACSSDGEIPPRREGLWDLSETTTIGRDVSRPVVAQHCIDAATDKAMRAFEAGLTRGKCSRHLRRRGDTLVIDAECTSVNLAFTAHGVSTGNLETNYTTKLTVKRKGSPAWPLIPPEMTVTTTARWIGACKIGQTPGDMLMPDGKTINIRSIPGIADLLPAAAPPSAPPAPAVEMPARRPGLWDVQSRFANDVLPQQSSKLCVSLELDREMHAAVSTDPRDKCTETVRRVGNSYVTEARCVGPLTTLVRVVTSGDFQHMLTSEIVIRREDGQPVGPGLPTELVATQQARWLSACPVDMQPGDILTPDGTKRNFREFRRAMARPN